MQIGDTLITSTSNIQVKTVINLLKKSGERKKSGLFVIEGLRIFMEAQAALVHRIYASESFIAAHGKLLDGFEYETVSDNVFRQMSDTRTPQGILAIMKMPAYNIPDITSAKNPMIIVLENIQDPGNLGTIMRSAEGAGAAGVIMSRDTVDIYNPKTIRSTMGSLFRVPFIILDDIYKTVCGLKDEGVKIYAARLDGSNEYYRENYCGPCAVMIGNEGNGLTDKLSSCADKYIRIPMEGSLESLNAAVSASVIMYEAARQRHEKTL